MKRRLLAALLLGSLAGLAARAVVDPTPRRAIRILLPDGESPGKGPVHDAEVWKTIG